MKALILAAGFGSRLAPITNTIPKSLVRVNGKPILFKQLDNLLNNGIVDITIISGYKADILTKEVNKYYKNINIIESKEYETTNNMYSAYLGISHIGLDDDILMMNADVFFDESIISSLLDIEAENSIVVDVGNYIEESMKVIKDKDRLVAISKQINKEEAFGVSIDVYRFSPNGLKIFYNKCKEYIEIKKDLKKWSEVALNDVLPLVVFKECPLNGRWVEIDNHDDLRQAEDLFNDL